MPLTRRTGLSCALLLVAAAMAGCQPARVQVTEEPGFSAASYGAYAWAPTGNAVVSVLPENRAAVTASIEASVERALTTRGWAAVPAGQADVHVRYLVGGADRYEVKQAGKIKVAGVERKVAVETDRYREGQLVIELIDPSSSRVLWRGVAEGSFHGVPSASEASSRAGRAATAVLERLR